MAAEYEGHRREDRLPATYEVVFGQAWAPVSPSRNRGTPGEVTVPIARIGRRPSLGTG
jgi:malonyl-CoA O-methyltransferase